MSTLAAKSAISFGAALLFALINLSSTYQISSQLLSLNLLDVNKCPTVLGQLVHTFVFFGLTFLGMGNVSIKTGIKLKHSLYGTLIYFLISSPAIYSLTGSLFGQSIASSSGCPTLLGIALHSLVCFLFLVAVMYLPNPDE